MGSGSVLRRSLTTEDLFREFGAYVARLLTRLGVPPAELDDAVQEVFLVVHRHGGYEPGDATPAGYLASIAVRAAASQRRHVRKKCQRSSDVTPDEMSSKGCDPARSLEVSESLAGAQEALDGLEPALRATLVLAELEGESCGSIAATMRVPVGTVYWRLHRARKTFRQRAQELGALGVSGFGWPKADELLALARVHGAVRFDVVAGLDRLQAALRSDVSTPAWSLAPAAGTGAGAGVAMGIGASVAAPAVLCALVAVHALGAAPLGRAAAQPANVRADHAANTDVRPDPAPRRADPVADFLPEALVETAQTTRPSSAVAAPGPAALTQALGPDVALEVKDVATAQELLSRDPLRALTLAREGELRFPRGYLREERRYVGVIALFKLGRTREARADAARFLSEYPDGPFAPRVRDAIAHAG